uniref:Uncharacterized protein n=1 Tax=Amorphochlora amoebiformis TaxID=1561963 RepID=A0A7S0DRA6_9EUKA
MAEIWKGEAFRRFHPGSRNGGKKRVHLVVSTLNVETREEVFKIAELLDDTFGTVSRIFNITITILTPAKPRFGSTGHGIFSQISHLVADGDVSLSCVSLRRPREVGRATIETWSESEQDIYVFIDPATGSTGLPTILPLIREIDEGAPMVLGVRECHNKGKTRSFKKHQKMLYNFFPDLGPRISDPHPTSAALCASTLKTSPLVGTNGPFFLVSLALHTMMRSLNISVVEVESGVCRMDRKGRPSTRQVLRQLISLWIYRESLDADPTTEPRDVNRFPGWRCLIRILGRISRYNRRVGSVVSTRTEWQNRTVGPRMEKALKVLHILVRIPGTRWVWRKGVVPTIGWLKKRFNVQSRIRTGFWVRTQVPPVVEENLPGFTQGLESIARLTLAKLAPIQLVGVMAMAGSELIAREVEHQLEPLPQEVKVQAFELIDKAAIAFEKKVVEMSKEGYALLDFREWAQLWTRSLKDVSANDPEAQETLSLVLRTRAIMDLEKLLETTHSTWSRDLQKLITKIRSTAESNLGPLDVSAIRLSNISSQAFSLLMVLQDITFQLHSRGGQG